MESSEGSNPHRKGRLNIQKSAQTIAPKKLVKADGGRANPAQIIKDFVNAFCKVTNLI